MRPNATKRFEVTLEGTHAVQIPVEIAAKFLDKGKQRVLVRAFSEKKEIEFHAALRKRLGNYLITFGKRHQKALEIFPNDYFFLQLIEDTSEYGVAMPHEMEAVLESDPDAMGAFETLSDGKKRSLIYHIRRIKTSQKRIERALVISENLKMGIRDNRELVKSHY